MQKKLVAVIGSHKADTDIYDLAFAVGKTVAKNDCVLICGGKEGVMEAAAKGAKEENGLTIGILPGTDKEKANPFIDIAIPTGLASARNAVIATACDIAVAVDGSYGTLSEIALCLSMGKTVLGLKTHAVEGVVKLDDVAQLEKYLAYPV